jgi:hypothetical protein
LSARLHRHGRHRFEHALPGRADGIGTAPGNVAIDVDVNARSASSHYSD